MKQFEVSFFKSPITNKMPLKTVSLFWIWLTVTMKWTQLWAGDCDCDFGMDDKTERLRGMADEKMQKEFKNRNFDYITPAGTFAYCNDDSLVDYSGALCIDLDHLDDGSEKMKRCISPEEMKQLLLNDPYWGQKILMMFTSPRGHGLKVFLQIDLSKCEYDVWFSAIRNYLMVTYGLGDRQVDPSVANRSHACFLSYDPDAYLRHDLYEFYI